jgi:hypothetical protein
VEFHSSSKECHCISFQVPPLRRILLNLLQVHRHRRTVSNRHCETLLIEISTCPPFVSGPTSPTYSESRSFALPVDMHRVFQVQPLRRIRRVAMVEAVPRRRILPRRQRILLSRLNILPVLPFTNHREVNPRIRRHFLPRRLSTGRCLPLLFSLPVFSVLAQHLPRILPLNRHHVTGLFSPSERV